MDLQNLFLIFTESNFYVIILAKERGDIMGYRLESKPVDLSGIRQLTYVPSKKAGNVYRFRNEAIRIFSEGEKPIDEETARYLSSISTERILLPKKLLFYNNAFKGYTMKLVSQRGASKKIISTPKRDLVESIQTIEKDIETISQRKVLLNNTGPGHTLYNGDLYLVDPSKYSILDLDESEQLQRINEFQFHLLFTEMITSEMRKFNFSQATINHMKEIMALRDNDQSTSDYLSEIIDGNSDIKQFAKKI